MQPLCMFPLYTYFLYLQLQQDIQIKETHKTTLKSQSHYLQLIKSFKRIKNIHAISLPHQDQYDRVLTHFGRDGWWLWQYRHSHWNPLARCKHMPDHNWWTWLSLLLLLLLLERWYGGCFGFL